MEVQPYLFFNGNCEEAIDFYKKVLGAKVEMMMRFNESPEKMPPGMLAPGWDDKVMHASMHIGGSLVMASDGMGTDKGGFNGFSLSLSCKDAAEATRLFNALSDGGQVQMPLGKTFWSPLFGMCADRFGVGWMVGAEH
ncbi:MAG TPA: VOC family protein [Casimicrobiaceae bacterium]|nr:VOC family protein [Casimicrobiaceae bacterium]